MEGSADAPTPRAAGQYASERERRGLRSYRGRLYRELGVGLMVVAIAELAIALWADTKLAWAGFGFMVGLLFGAVYVLRETPPDHVRRWGSGAWGERKTAKAVEPLAKEGWRIQHDVQLERGNIDHLVESPRGRRFVLETKALSGTITIEEGVLTTTQTDDPEQIYRAQTLRHVVLERARGQYRERAGTGGWVQAVVVIWGDFPQRRVEDGKLVFVHGEELVSWLRGAGL